MAFCCEKIKELAFIGSYFHSDIPEESFKKQLKKNTEILKLKSESSLISNPLVSKRLIKNEKL